jgi:hypothetical protein
MSCVGKLCRESYENTQTLSTYINGCLPAGIKQTPSKNNFHCLICNKVFKSNQALNYHKKICKAASYTCSICQAVYRNQKAFLKHEALCKGPLICSLCNKYFTTKYNLNRHKKTCRGEVSNSKVMHSSGQKISNKFNDLKNYQSLIFDSLSKFYDWKKMIDRQSFSYQRKVRGTKIIKSIKYHYFKCIFSSASSQKQLNRKTVHMRKYGQIPPKDCKSKIQAKECDDGKIYVKYFPKHSHSCTAKNRLYHRWNPETTVAVKNLLTEGVSVNEIRKKFIMCANTQFPLKEHFMTNRQILRYKYRLQMKNRYSADDATSIKHRIDSMSHEQRKNILIYKPQGCPILIGNIGNDNSSSDLFIYGFQTNRQLQEFKSGAGRILCIDATHKTNRYDFYLLNLLVPDEYNNGFVVAQFITNILDRNTIKILFTSLRNRCPDTIVNAVMTDDDPAIWEAFCDAFHWDDPNLKPKHLLCKWHIVRAWKLQCTNKIKSKILRCSVFKDLIVILEEKNTSDFEILLQNFFQKYAMVECTKFINYFQTYYMRRPELWAMCFRNVYHADVDTNMFAESFHNVLKKRLDRKSNHRVDDLIEILEELEYERWLKLTDRRTKGEPPIPFSNSNSRHKMGMKILPNIVLKNNDCSWEIKFENESHYVWQIRDECHLNDHCYDKCPNIACLDLCSHLYKCTCIDISSMYRHVHRIHSLRTKDIPRYLDQVNLYDEDEDMKQPEIDLYVASTSLKQQHDRIPAMDYFTSPNRSQTLQRKMYRTAKKRGPSSSPSLTKPEKIEARDLKLQLLSYPNTG